VAFKTKPPYSSENGETSVPPPAKPSRSGARALMVLPFLVILFYLS
jgi:hypothetical protein